MKPEDAAKTVAQMTTQNAADIIGAVAADKAAAILNNVAADKAAAIVDALTAAKATSVVEQMASDKAAAALEKVGTDKTAAILESVATSKAAAIMEQLTTQKLNTTISKISEKALTERLPGLSVEKLYSLDSSTLFKALPNAPTEQLVGETPPSPPAELGKPVVVLTTASGAKYLAVKTLAGEWAMVVGTPLPLDKLLIKTKRGLSNVGTTIDILSQRPPEVAVGLPADQTVLTYVTIAFENAAPADIELGHLTFKIEQEWLQRNSLHKWSVQLNSWNKETSSWVAIPTKRVKEDSTYAYYSAVLTHFSTFAITGSTNPPVNSIKVTNLVISPTTAKPGTVVNVSGQITNTSETNQTFPLTLWIDSTAETGKDIVLEAGVTRSVSFTVAKAAEGTHQVRLDRASGEFEITKPGGANLLVIVIGGIVAVVLVALAVWMIIVRRRTD